MPTSKLTKRAVDALVPPAKKQAVLWDTELKGFGVRVLPSGLKTFIVQYRNAEGIKRRINIARYGVLTVDQARDQAKLKLAAVIGGVDPADEVRQARKGMTVEEMCDWYLTEARAGNILGRKNLPIKKSSLDMDESRIRTHIKPLLGKRIVKHLTIADVEQMQTDVKDGKTAKPRSGGRGGMATGGAGVAARCVGTLQAIIGHAKHKGLLDAHPTQGAKKLAGVEGITPHTLRHTFGSVAGDLGFSELTIRAMLGHASQNVTQDYIHIDEALKLAVRRTSDEIEQLLMQGVAELKKMPLAA